MQFGHNRDGKRDLPIMACGVLTDAEGRPVAVEVYPGNTADPSTVPDQVETLKGHFGLERVVLVGDRRKCLAPYLSRIRCALFERRPRPLFQTRLYLLYPRSRRRDAGGGDARR